MSLIPLRTPADVGALIRDRRRALRWDQADLAARIGVSRLWINQIERGKPGASLGLVLRALDALGTPPMVEVGDAPEQIEGDAIPSADLDAIIDRARRARAIAAL